MWAGFAVLHQHLSIIIYAMWRAIKIQAYTSLRRRACKFSFVHGKNSLFSEHDIQILALLCYYESLAILQNNFFFLHFLGETHGTWPTNTFAMRYVNVMMCCFTRAIFSTSKSNKKHITCWILRWWRKWSSGEWWKNNGLVNATIRNNFLLCWLSLSPIAQNLHLCMTTRPPKLLLCK